MTHPDIVLARRALPLLDLTDLTDNCSSDAVARLCERAAGRHGAVAAVCIWARFVAEARARLFDTPVKVCTVVNFPSGDASIDGVVAETRQALADGADEVDLVLPYRGFLAGDVEHARAMVTAVRAAIPVEHCLKVILETGELGTREAIAAASRVAIEEGADFIKTSTGKVPVNATPEAAEIMLTVIRDTGCRTGFKAAGGIRDLATASVYLDLADRILGPDWVRPQTFRLGASGLLDALIDTIEGKAA